MEESSSQKAQRILLELNKNGLSYLTNNHQTQAYEYFKMAQKGLAQQLKINPFNQKINQLAGITYNNLACYYKKNNKPKVALSYLKKALQIEVYKVQDWTSTASTHLNICAIYSYLKRHQESADHAELALTMLDKVDINNLKESQVEGQKSYCNIKMLSHYNLAIQLQHLKNFKQSKTHYIKAQETALLNGKKHQTLINSIECSILQVEEQQKQQKMKLIQLLAKRKIQEEKGNHQFMRKNKKNYGDQNQWKPIVQTQKYQLYKKGNQTKRHMQSSERIRKLAPINQRSRSKRQLEVIF